MFKVGDCVLINYNELKNDPLHFGVAECMREAAYTRKKLAITEKYIRSDNNIIYTLSDWCVYSENWLMSVESEKVYHKDKKINAVIIKMKHLENKFNTRRLLDESTPF